MGRRPVWGAGRGTGWGMVVNETRGIVGGVTIRTTPPRSDTMYRAGVCPPHMIYEPRKRSNREMGGVTASAKQGG